MIDPTSRHASQGTATPADDRELLRCYADEKSQMAFAGLVARHVDLVYSAALRRVGGDAHAAADVAQQVFTRLARQAASLARERVVLPAWLYATTRNVAVDFVRSERRRRAREQEAHIMNELSAGPTSGAADWDQLRPLLDHAMDALSARDREVVLLRFFARRPFAEIGAAFDLSEDAARMRVDRALEKLRAWLARRGVTSTSGALALALGNQAVTAAPTGLAATIAGTALAGAVAAGGSGTFAGAAILMSIGKIGLGVAALAVVVAMVSVALRGSRDRALAEAQVVAASDDYGRDEARLRELARSVRAAERAAAKSSPAAAAASRAPSAGGGQNEVRAATAKPVMLSPTEAGKDFLARHPEVKQAFLEWNAATLNAKWAPFYRARGLTPAQIARFQELKRGEHSLAFETHEDDVVSESLTFYVGTGLGKSAVENALRELLGPAGHEAYLEFQRTETARGFAAQIASALSFSETPLTSVQAEQVAQIIDRNRSAQIGPLSSQPLLRFDWDAVRTEARSLLSAPQLAMLDAMRAEDRYRQLWYRRTNPRAAPR